MGILVIGMRYEFGEDVKAIAPMIEFILSKERKRHNIYHWNSEVIDYSKDTHYKSYPDNNELPLIDGTQDEEFMYVLGVHFGRCLQSYGRLLRCPIGMVLNATLCHPGDKWKKVLKQDYPLYLWGEKQGFYKL